jgi:hypothetical protein
MEVVVKVRRVSHERWLPLSGREIIYDNPQGEYLLVPVEMKPAEVLCDECGPNINVDEDGCCISCGRDAINYGTCPELDKAADEIERLRDAIVLHRIMIRRATDAEQITGPSQEDESLWRVLNDDNWFDIDPLRDQNERLQRVVDAVKDYLFDDGTVKSLYKALRELEEGCRE